MGQSFRATHVFCHVASQARGVAPCAMSFPSWRSRIYNSVGSGGHLTQLMGHDLAISQEPLMANITGPGAKLAATHIVTTRAEEDQLDVQSMVLTTLSAGGTVLILGAGQMRVLPTLDVQTPVPAGRPIQAYLRCHSQCNQKVWLQTHIFQLLPY